MGEGQDVPDGEESVEVDDAAFSYLVESADI